MCGTPIGNLEDVSPRALRVLAEADLVACEDTRRTRKLLTYGGIRARELVSYHEGNERRRARALVDRISGGAVVVLVSDAGMPGLSDPGYRLVRECVDAGHRIEVVPGPSAVVSALAVSGLPPGRFAFEGFLPRRPGDRVRRIHDIEADTRTLIFFESPHRLEDALKDLLEGLGDRPACIARELTKLHEEVHRGRLSELLAGVRKAPPRGEMVLVVGGAIHADRVKTPPDELARRARRLMDGGMDRREALAEVARTARVSRREVFDALVEEKND